MTLADAIRKGAEQHPQCYGAIFHRNTQQGSVVTKTCALGAALIGLFGRAGARSSVLHAELIREFPELDARNFPNCPIKECIDARASRIDSLMGVIVHLNDRHRWTREEIADFLDETGNEGPPLALIHAGRSAADAGSRMPVLVA